MQGWRATSLVAGWLAGNVACTSDEYPPLELDEDASGGASGSGDDAGSDDSAVLQDAALEVFEPEPASIHFVGEPLPLLAEIREPSGLPTAFQDIVWSTGDPSQAILGTGSGEVQLPAGIYDLTATSNLPDGTRLQSTVGGVRVQSLTTGTWRGELSFVLSLDLGGIPLAPACSAPIAFTVGLDGGTIASDGGLCNLDLLLLQVPATFGVEVEPGFGGIVTGSVTIEFVGIFAVAYDLHGIFGDRTLYSDFDGELAIPLVGNGTIAGTLTADQVSRYLEPQE